VRFARAAFTVRNSLVHRIELQLAEPGNALPSQLTGLWPRLLTSDWEFDRIAAYLLGVFTLSTPAPRTSARSRGRDARLALEAARQELAFVRAASQSVLMPLYYSLGWVEAAGRIVERQLADKPRDLADELRSLADAVDGVIVARADLDSDARVQDLVSTIRAHALWLDSASATSQPD
jgi:hypothetical protein